MEQNRCEKARYYLPQSLVSLYMVLIRVFLIHLLRRGQFSHSSV